MITSVLILIAGVILVLGAFAVARMQKDGRGPTIPWSMRVVGVLMILGGMVYPSVVLTPGGSSLHLTKRRGKTLPDGRIVVLPEEYDEYRGHQADIHGEGFYIKFMLRLFYDVEKFKDPVVPEGQIMIITAKDGNPLPAGQAFVPPLNMTPEETREFFQDAAGYLESENGYRGGHTTALRSGRVRLNQHLFSHRFVDPPRVGANEYGIVNCLVAGTYPIEDAAYVKNEGEIPADLDGRVVEVGQQGVWRWAVRTGFYPFNPKVIQIVGRTAISNTTQFKGGLEYLKATPSWDDKGTLTFRIESATTPIDELSQSPAISFQPEGFDQSGFDYRLIWSVIPKYLPYIYARYPDSKELEKFVIASTRSTCRKVGNSGALPVLENDPTMEALAVLDAAGVVGVDVNEPNQPNQPTLTNNRVILVGSPDSENPQRMLKGLDFIYRRADTDDALGGQLAIDLEENYIQVVGGEMGNVYLNGMLLMPLQRARAALDNMKAFKREEESELARIDKENASALAEQQSEIVAADVAVQVSLKMKDAAKNKGDAEQNFLDGAMLGYGPVAEKLGDAFASKVFMTRLLSSIATDILSKPEQTKALAEIAEKFPMPETLVHSSGGGGSSTDALVGIMAKMAQQAASQAAPSKSSVILDQK